MQTLNPPQAPTTEAFLSEAGPRLADLCTACGACLQACPMSAHIPELATADPTVVTAGMRAMARGGSGPPEAVAWVAACGRSGLCVSACPEQSQGLDAMLLIRIAKQKAMNATGQIPPKHEPTAFPRVKTFARLQLTDEELAAWL